MTKEERIKLRQTQCNAINQAIPKVDKYFVDYCKALKEIWKEKIDTERDFSILESYDLGTYEHNQNHRYYFNNYSFKFKWNSEITDLDKFYKQCCKN